ncbi:MAG: glycosyltransferase family 4 protein [Acidobacteriia bacterium]|nr:glycosyltransferase family 4 protein [Terriglobia bacterium]
MKVIHVDTSHSLRGGQQQLLFLMEEFRKQNVEQKLIVPQVSALADQAAPKGFPVERLNLEGLALFGAIGLLRNCLAEFRPDILHLHDGRAHGLGQWANQKSGIPAVIARRIDFPIRRNWFSGWKYARSKQRFIAVSQAVKQTLIESGIPEGRIDVVYDCVDPALEPSLTMKNRKNSSEFVIGCVGAFEPEKGQGLLIQAVARAKERIPGLRCILAGEGQLREDLKHRVEQLSLPGVVSVEHFPESLPEFMARLDLFVLPSLQEGLGSINLVALRCGVPVLASNTGGVSEIIRDQNTGFLFSCGDGSALSEALVRLHDDRATLSSVIAPAQEHVLKNFSCAWMAGETLKVYQSLLETN